ncbi:hypothetical protein PSHT_12744 [Puccinia striiformis]|uniref:Uncharacterized protein n=1 Tax=Puccinia striiformis TaxID=27350 RepID=A0A2S4UUP8_9BASI|nr:hypothetical protein PSHT_12744 [Puccinia striiformis]
MFVDVFLRVCMKAEYQKTGQPENKFPVAAGCNRCGLHPHSSLGPAAKVALKTIGHRKHKRIPSREQENTIPNMVTNRRIDPGTSQTTDVVVDALKKLSFPLASSMDEDANDKGRMLTAEEIEVRKGVLVEIRTKILPLLGRQLSDLLNSLDDSDLGRDPNPRLHAMISIANRIEDTLLHLKSTTNLVALETLPIPEDEDYECGVFKRFRSTRLLDKINELLEEHISPLSHHSIQFVLGWQSSDNPSGSISPTGASGEQLEPDHHRKKVIGIANQTCQTIQSTIEWLELDEFGLLQHEWQTKLDLLNSLDLQLLDRIDRPLPIEQKRKRRHSSDSECDCSDESEDEEQESNSPLVDQPEDDGQSEDVKKSRIHLKSTKLKTTDKKMRPSQTKREMSLQAKENRSEEDPSGDDGDGDDDDDESGSDEDSNYSGSSDSTGHSGIVPVRRGIKELARLILPMIKMVRIFMGKLSESQVKKAPFILDEQMSSDELNSLLKRVGRIVDTLNEFLTLALTIYDDDDLDDDQLDRLRSESGSIAEQFDSALLLLAFFLVPAEDSPAPLTHNHFNNWFCTLRAQIHNASDSLRGGIYDLESTLFED